jgi:hypothetical protein
VEVGTRNASQVRSHAQKYFSKKQNDEQKIGRNNTFIIGDQKDRTNTRGRLRAIEEIKNSKGKEN